MTTQRFSGVVSAILALVAGVELASAQVTATISGKVEDASGAAVGAATVSVKNLETGAIRTVRQTRWETTGCFPCPWVRMKFGRRNLDSKLRFEWESILLSLRKLS